MAFEFYKEAYSGEIKTVSLGKEKSAIHVGGETCYPFYQFEGQMPHKPRIAMEVWDMKPEDWAEAALKPFEDVADDPAAWARRCVEEYGADMIALLLRSTDPNDKDASPEAAAETVKKVLGAVDVPLIVWGTTAPQKDEDVLKKIAEACQGEKLVLGPVEDTNHKGIGAAAMGFGHTLASSSPIDVNLAKQVNILLENLGMPMDRIIIDPTTGGLGYGMEYSYSVMERLRMAAMAQGDDKLQFPLINNLGYEVWKSKEAKQPSDEAPSLGDPERRGILMEITGAISYLMAGSDVLILRHPESVRLVKAFIDLGIDGGAVGDIAEIGKLLSHADIDFAEISPQPDLTLEAEKKPEPAKAAKTPEPPKESVKIPETPKKSAKIPETPKPSPVEAAPSAAAPAPSVNAETEAQIRAKLEAEIRAKIEMEMRLQADASEKLAADEELELKAKAEKAEAEQKAQMEAKEKAATEALAKAEAEEAVIRKIVEKAREERIRKLAEAQSSPKISSGQKSRLNKLVDQIDWANKNC